MAEGNHRKTLPDPPPLRDNCFALPPGVDWIPLEQAKEALRSRLHPVIGEERRLIYEAEGYILSQPVHAIRDNPPFVNSAVDGYAIRAEDFPGDGPFAAEIMAGRAAAGAPFRDKLGPECAIRILTGAEVPDGANAVILEEDCSINRDMIAFRGPVKKFSNIRPAGEDAQKGQRLLDAGHRLTIGDIAWLAATGHREIFVRRKLRVAVFSTGDELREAGLPVSSGQLNDANRPFLIPALQRLGHEPVDFGILPDDKAKIRQALDRGAHEADAIITSGGASAGDEDHLSHLLREAGEQAIWRIALKPGRPLCLAQWGGVPVFGLPGNPVAAYVTFLLMARPALGMVSGRPWHEPTPFLVPSGFSKSKREGRAEFLRAKIGADGRVQRYASEGSGRVGSLAFAEGLVALPHEACSIELDQPILYIPLASFWN